MSFFLSGLLSLKVIDDHRQRLARRRTQDTNQFVGDKTMITIYLKKNNIENNYTPTGKITTPTIVITPAMCKA